MGDTLTEEAPAAQAPEQSAAPPPQPESVKPPMTVANGLRLTTLPEMEAFARYVIASGFAPRGIDSISKGVIALQIGTELGMTPMLSLQSIAPIHGTPTLWGDAMLGLCQRSKHFDHAVFAEWFTDTPMQDDWTAHTKVRRHGGQIVERTFSVADAKRAKLWADTKKPTWNTHPQRMLQYKARAFALRDTFADVLKGLHAAEEMIEVDNVLSQIDLTGTTRTEQLKEHLKANGAAPEPTDSPPTEAPSAAVSDGMGPAAAVPEPPEREQPQVFRENYLVRLGDVVQALPDEDAKELRKTFRLASLIDGRSLKNVSDRDLAALTIAAETRVKATQKAEA